MDVNICEAQQDSEVVTPQRRNKIRGIWATVSKQRVEWDVQATWDYRAKNVGGDHFGQSNARGESSVSSQIEVSVDMAA